jgi:mRNA interferase MazF
MRMMLSVKNGREETSLSNQPVVVRRGEVWRVNLDPTIGAEIQKTRPVVVVSSDAIGILPIKLVAPVTDWKDRYAHSSWHVKIDPDTANGLTKTSAVDTLQLRGVDTSRFLKRLGRVSADKIEEIAAAIAAVVEYA